MRRRSFHQPNSAGLLLALLLVCAGSLGEVKAAPAPGLRAFTIVHGLHYLREPTIAGRFVVWLAPGHSTRTYPDLRHVSLGDVYGKDLRTGKTRRITTRSTAVTDPIGPEGTAGQVAASEKVVAWTDCRHCRDVQGLGGVAGVDIYARDLPSGRETRLPGAFSAAVAGRIVFWVDCCGGRRVYATNARSGRTRLFLAGGRISALSTDGRTLAYADNGDIVARDLKSGADFVVARHRGRGYLSDPIHSPSLAHSACFSGNVAESSGGQPSYPALQAGLPRDVRPHAG